MGALSSGTSLVLIAIGAILTWAVTYTVSGIDLRLIGVILMITGGIGVILSLVAWTSVSPFRRDVTVIEHRERDDERGR